MTAPHEVLVVGGGPAGASAACHLAAAGQDVVLVEREAEARDKVCGEFLSYEALDYLRELGVDPAMSGAPTIDTVGVAFGSTITSRSLGFRAASLSRRRLDEALLDRAHAVGARVLRGAGVRTLERGSVGWVARLTDGSAVEAREAFIATGKHDLRDRKRPAGRQNDLIGLKLHVRLDPAQAAELANRVELFAFRGGYGGLEPIEDGLANLCLLVRKSRFAEVGNRWYDLRGQIALDCETVGRRLDRAEPVHAKPLAIASIPYGLVRRSTSGAWHLGDQAAVIPSFAGEGMAIALHSGRLAARLHLDGQSAAEFQHRLAEDVSAQVRLATWLSQACVARAAAPILLTALRFFPGSLGGLARATRLPHRAVDRAMREAL